MAENYKHLYEQTKKMLAMYQDELVPGFRKTIEEMEKNRVEVVRCKDCKHYFHYGEGVYGCRTFGMMKTQLDGFCSYGERKDNGIRKES